MTPPFVSVIIPCYNDPERLSACVSALERQSYPSDRYEVIVVDNGSTMSIDPSAGSQRHVRVIEENRHGSYAARNAGILIARGEVIAFTDSDTLPSADWIEKGVHALSATPDCGVVGGRIVLFFEDPQRPTAVELYDLVWFCQEEFVTTLGFAATANLFTRRQTIENVGMFNAALKSSGDREWCGRALAAGYGLSYCDDACVAHPARRTLADAYSRTLRIVSGGRDLAQLRSGRVSLARQVRDIAIDMCPPLLGVFRKSFSRRVEPGQRLKVAGITLVMRYMQAWARIQLLFRGYGQIR